jgi:hypothetical protein
MSFKKYAVLAAFAATLPVQAANAQTLSSVRSNQGADTAPRYTVSNVSLNTLTLAALDPATTETGFVLQPARQPLPQRGFFVKTHIGAWTSAGSGLLLGAGIAALPFDGPQHEITGNISYLRWEGEGGFMIDANYLYNFALEGGRSFTPYAGAGLNVAHIDVCGDIDDDLDDLFDDFLDCGRTDTNLQIGGGIKAPFGSAGRELFGEIFFIVDDGGPIIVRGGVNW